MKTNHRRGFKDRRLGNDKLTHRIFKGFGRPSEYSDTYIGANYPGIGSKRQNARYIAGAKKFVRTRTRFHEKAATKKLAVMGRYDDD